jgi:hypothetical protein
LVPVPILLAEPILEITTPPPPPLVNKDVSLEVSAMHVKLHESAFVFLVFVVDVAVVVAVVVDDVVAVVVDDDDDENASAVADDERDVYDRDAIDKYEYVPNS